MKQFKCQDCDAIFDEDEIEWEEVTDSFECWGSYVTGKSYYKHCPHCYSEDIEDYDPRYDDEQEDEDC